MKSRVKLITEISRNVKISREDGELFITGIYSSAELLNNNGRRYKKDTLSREVEKVMEKVSNKCLWGELGHPPTPEINPDKIAILTEHLEWDSDNLMGKSKVLDTPMGNIAKVLINEGRLGVSSRGLGTVSEEDNYVNEDFNLITWDLVTDPSNHPSWVNGIYEEHEFEVYKKVLKEDDEKAEEELEEKEKQLILDQMVAYYQTFLLKGRTKDEIVDLYEKKIIRWPL
jgi:hypothetical protein